MPSIPRNHLASRLRPHPHRSITNRRLPIDRRFLPASPHARFLVCAIAIHRRWRSDELSSSIPPSDARPSSLDQSAFVPSPPPDFPAIPKFGHSKIWPSYPAMGISSQPSRPLILNQAASSMRTTTRRRPTPRTSLPPIIMVMVDLDNLVLAP